jgi:hypothetical protein
MKGFIFFLLAFMNTAIAQMPAPQMEYVCTIEVKIDPALIVGESVHGVRRIIPIIGGTVRGPHINGEVLNGGADWQNLRKDGVAEIEARYQFKTDDGIIIYIKNAGMRIASPEIAAKIASGEQVDQGLYYFRTVLQFEAPIGKYDWLNKSIFICSAERLATIVKIHVWKLL